MTDPGQIAWLLLIISATQIANLMHIPNGIESVLNSYKYMKLFYLLIDIDIFYLQYVSKKHTKSYCGWNVVPY